MEVRSVRPAFRGAALACSLVLLHTLFVLGGRAAEAQVPPGTPPPLSAQPVPTPPTLGQFVGTVSSRTVAVELGKALFWDMQVGSDGRQACATCHFAAGVDTRLKNTLNPDTPSTTPSFGLKGPNATLAASDFPFTVQGGRDTHVIVGSQGIADGTFKDIRLKNVKDLGAIQSDTTFEVKGTDVRRVTGRQAPSVINAAFNHRNFWDGRAKNRFNGTSPFGDQDPDPQVFEDTGSGLTIVKTFRLDDASLCSQATGPATSNVEMSYNGRTWPKIGKKLLTLTPLGEQLVAADDGVLGGLSRNRITAGARGLAVSYDSLIRRAFDPKLWRDTTQIVTFDANGVASVHPRPTGPLTTAEFTQEEANFSVFFGIAVQLYIATLISDESPFDVYCAAAAKGQDSTAMDTIGHGHARVGLAVFLGDVGYVDRHNGLTVSHSGRCINCHGGPELTNASVSHVLAKGTTETTFLWGGATKALFDTGFRNTGVRPVANDVGLGGKDPFGHPLSFARLAGHTTPAVDGAFKIPGLRNVELTGPYFHNGGKATLRQVLDFYNRGGDFFSQNIGNMDDELRQILDSPMSGVEEDWIVDLLQAMTDPRVRSQSAPFDHPELFVADGAVGDDKSVTKAGDGTAVDVTVHIPATGKTGSTTPLKSFLNLDPHQP